MDTKIKLAVVIGARPQFIKHAAIDMVAKALFEVVTIHTGQHYDQNMSNIFFEELQISKPSYMLNIGSANHGTQTGQMMIHIEQIVEKEQPDMMLVYGDTNSTLAGALVASKLNIPVAHIEAGLRSHNREMPEEINRVLTDHVSSLHFCPTVLAQKALITEGIVEQVHVVGDVMCDMIRIAKEKGMIRDLQKSDYYFTTIHRPYNTDDPARLLDILKSLNELAYKSIFSIHPRTRNLLNSLHFDFSKYEKIEFIDPVSYFESLSLQFNAKAVITDSGGIQKEAYILKKKCVTIRSETEWDETLVGNWNTLVFNDLSSIGTALNTDLGEYTDNAYGDGFAAEKICEVISHFLSIKK